MCLCNPEDDGGCFQVAKVINVKGLINLMFKFSF